MRKRTLSGVIVGLTLVLAACGDDSESAGNDAGTEAPEATDAGATTAAGHVRAGRHDVAADTTEHCDHRARRGRRPGRDRVDLADGDRDAVRDRRR